MDAHLGHKSLDKFYKHSYDTTLSTINPAQSMQRWVLTQRRSQICLTVHEHLVQEEHLELGPQRSLMEPVIVQTAH